MESFNWMLEKAIAPPSWRDSVMLVLFPKKGKIKNIVSHQSLIVAFLTTPGVFRTGVMGKQDIYLFKILSFASKKAITRRWLKTDPPELTLWLDIVEEI